jgi:hypothetical protein
MTSCQSCDFTLYTQWQGCRLLCCSRCAGYGAQATSIYVYSACCFSFPQSFFSSSSQQERPLFCCMCSLPGRHTCMWGPDWAADDLTVSVPVQPAQFTPSGPQPCPKVVVLTASAAGSWCFPVLYLVPALLLQAAVQCRQQVAVSSLSVLLELMRSSSSTQTERSVSA